MWLPSALAQTIQKYNNNNHNNNTKTHGNTRITTTKSATTRTPSAPPQMPNHHHLINIHHNAPTDFEEDWRLTNDERPYSTHNQSKLKIYWITGKGKKFKYHESVYVCGCVKINKGFLTKIARVKRLWSINQYAAASATQPPKVLFSLCPPGTSSCAVCCKMHCKK